MASDDMHAPLTDAPSLFNSISAILPPFLLDKPARFSFDTAGLLGLLGGNEALSAMASVHIYGTRRYLGWYNSPGSFQIFRRLDSFADCAQLAKLPSENVHTDPRTLFKLGASKGPKFHAAHSGTAIEETGYLATLFMKECAAWGSDGRVVPGRRTQPIRITIADIDQEPTPEVRPTRTDASAVFFASFPVVASVGGCALCAVYEDWYASSLILMGIFASGMCCLVLGSADFMFSHPVPAKGSPAGDGILGSDKEMVLLRGTEGAVNSITRGKFSFSFSNKARYGRVRWCSYLFFIQYITQLLLIPQASSFGQIVFLVSLCASALYHAWVSSLDSEKIHRKFLFGQVLESPKLSRYTLGTRTSAVVFILLVLQPQDPRGLLNELLPNDTKVWQQWKEVMLERLHQPSDQSFQLQGKVGCLEGFTQQEMDLLTLLYEDARSGYNGYKDYIHASWM